jgi:hypothetical protein
MVRIEIAREREFGVNDNSFIVNTHLGEHINYNDTLMGYDLNECTAEELVDYELDNKSNRHQLPDVVIVKKCFNKVNRR